MNAAGLINLVGAGAGLFAALVVFSQMPRRRANLWLGLFVASCALLCAQEAVFRSDLALDCPDAVGWFEPLMLALGPCLYLYFRAFTGRGLARRRLWVHFLPCMVLALLALRWHLALSTGEKLWSLQIDRERPLLLDPIRLVTAAQLLIYLVTSFWHLSRRSLALRGVSSNLDRISFAWLRRLLGINLGLFLVWLPTVGPGNTWAQLLMALAFPMAIYLLALGALKSPEVFAPALPGALPTPVEDLEELALPAPDPPPDAREEDMEGDKYRKSRLPDALIIRYEQRLQATMATHKGFLDPELSLGKLADQVGISPHHLSQVMNERLGVKFCDYINALRVEEAQRLLLDPACAGETILEVAMRAGFSSKATFNTTFKRRTGHTPTAWRERHPKEKGA